MKLSPSSVQTAEKLGRMRLSKNFFMREFLYSEIAAVYGMKNLPTDPDRAVESGRALCEYLLEPLQATFGRISPRSGYRSPDVNSFGNQMGFSCAQNYRDRARHIWDEPDDTGYGAMATIVIPWLVDRIPAGAKWQEMAWWIHDNLPYSELMWFPKLLAFNISWHEKPKRTIYSYVAPKGYLTKPGMGNFDGSHEHLYPDYPELVPVD